MATLKDEMKGLKRFGNAKIAGLTCNKRAPATIRIDLEVNRDKIHDVLSSLGLEMTDDLKQVLEAMVSTSKT